MKRWSLSRCPARLVTLCVLLAACSEAAQPSPTGVLLSIPSPTTSLATPGTAGSTPHPAGTTTPAPPFFSDPALMLFATPGYDLYLLDVATGESTILTRGFWKPLRWQDQACSLIVINENGELAEMDLSGVVRRTMFAYESLQEAGEAPWGLEIFPSPNSEWVWYWEGSGDPSNEIGQDVRMERQDIKVVSMDLEQGPFSITGSSGGYVGEWSPDSKMLAFSDYDAGHVQQVFVSSPQGNNTRQLSAFQERSEFDHYDAGISRILWSPDSPRIAVNHFESGLPRFAVFDLAPENASRPTVAGPGTIVGWIDAAKFVALSSAQEGKTLEVIDLTNPANGKNLPVGADISLPEIRPFAGTTIVGFFEGDRFSIWDTNTGIVKHQPQVHHPPDGSFFLFTTPAGFPGPDQCWNS